MLKKFTAAIFAVILTVICSSCGGCEHEWTEATCTDAKSCNLCGITEGEALGHTWTEATYESPKTCSACGLTEGEKLFDPTYSEENVLASEAIQKIQPYIDFLTVSEKTFVYNEDERSFTLTLTPVSGAANAYAGRGDQWGLYTTYLKYLSTDGKWFFSESGLDISFRVVLLDDRDGSSVLFEAENGIAITDVYYDIVPQFLKSVGFEAAFMTLYHNYGALYELTAEYNEASGILYFFMKLDGTTSLLFNSLSSAELAQNNVWKSLTDSSIRWSADYTQSFIDEGHDVLCAVMLIDGTTAEDVFYCAAGGEVIYNAFE